jgi:chaperonin GroES
MSVVKSNLTRPVGAIPMNDRVFIRRLKERAITRGGIHLTDSAQEKPHFGVVVSAGHAVRDPHLARGYVMVTFGKYAGTEIEIDGEELLSMREEEVTAIITDRHLVEDLLLQGA